MWLVWPGCVCGRERGLDLSPAAVYLAILSPLVSVSPQPVAALSLCVCVCVWLLEYVAISVCVCVRVFVRASRGGLVGLKCPL